jgi:hypothetical protein
MPGAFLFTTDFIKPRTRHMAADYGLRNPKTGRIIRINSFMLSEDLRDPVWRVELTDLVATFCEDREVFQANATVPCWGVVDVRACEPIRHVIDTEYDVEGGDPVSVTKRIERFDIGNVYDFRGDMNFGGDIASKHYGPMQSVFSAYDMDKVETMSLGLVFFDGGFANLRGDIGLTRDRGPARIVGVADVPSDWPLTDAQIDHRHGWKRSLILLDTAELESWLDFDNVDADPTIKCSAVN